MFMAEVLRFERLSVCYVRVLWLKLESCLLSLSRAV